MKNISKSVLLLDGNTRSALAVTRSLGKSGFTIIVGADEAVSLAGSSKFCSCTVRYPSIKNYAKEFKVWLVSFLEKTKPDFIIPCSDQSLTEILEIEDKVSRFSNLPFSKKSAIDKSQDKFEILRIAGNIGINCPKTLALTKENLKDLDFVNQLINQIGLPLVFKGRRSIQNTSQAESVKPPLKYANSANDVKEFLTSELPIEFEYIAQEYIEGEGRGIFLLIRDNKNIATFAHKRILEKPPEGGVSVLSESISADTIIVTYCENLLKELNWQGVAMFEFKYTKDNKHYLMEINPRFWGSLQLALNSGVNFPEILLNDKFEKDQINYQTGLRLRWELGLLDHLFIQLKRKPLLYLKKLLLNNPLELFRKDTKNEVFNFSDSKPFIFEFKNYLKMINKQI